VQPLHYITPLQGGTAPPTLQLAAWVRGALMSLLFLSLSLVVSACCLYFSLQYSVPSSSSGRHRIVVVRRRPSVHRGLREVQMASSPHSLFLTSPETMLLCFCFSSFPSSSPSFSSCFKSFFCLPAAHKRTGSFCVLHARWLAGSLTSKLACLLVCQFSRFSLPTHPQFCSSPPQVRLHHRILL